MDAHVEREGEVVGLGLTSGTGEDRPSSISAGGAQRHLASSARFRHTRRQETVREAIMRKRVLGVLCAAGVAVAVASPALGQEVDIQKAIHCQTLAQQFGDSIKTAKAEDGVKKTATDQAKQGDQACNQRNYDAGMDQLRQALQQVGLKPAR
jgi:hypothetical protein